MRTTKTYKIRAGHNYSNRFNLPLPNRLLYKPTQMTIKLTLNETMVYRNENNGWMKLGGFSRGHHHDNSFRFVWRCWEGFFQIAAYCYYNKIRDDWPLASWPISKIPFGCEITLTVSITKNRINFDLASVCHKKTGFVVGFNDYLPPIGYLLTPHFENPKSEQTGAPHNIKIPMQIEIV